MKLAILDLGHFEYGAALAVQQETLAAVQAGQAPDTLILVEHPTVITLGRNAQPENLLLTEEALARRGIALKQTDRGGDVTYHGPGQLVGYPIFNIKARHGASIRTFVENLETVFIDLLREQWQLPAGRSSCNSGVFIGNDKILAIGLSVKRGVTMHGFAFNVTTDLSHYGAIVPCGLTDKGVTSLEAQTGRAIPLAEIKPLVAEGFRKQFGFE